MRHLAREALANVRHSRRRLRPLVVAAVLLGATVPLVATIDSVSYRLDLAALERAGANVIVIASEEGERGIDRRSCDRLSDLSGIARSGSILTSTRAPVIGVGASVAIVPVTGNLAAALTFSPVAIGYELTDAMTQTMVLSGVVVEGRRDVRQPDGIPLNRALAISAPHDVRSVERCVVVVGPGVSAPRSVPVVVAALDTTTSSLAGTLVHVPTIDRTAAFLDRPTRWAPVAAGALLGILQAVTMMTRQSELAAYRLSGTPPSTLRTILMFEALVITGAMAASATAAAVALGGVLFEGPATAFGGLAAAGIAFIAAAIAASAYSRQSLLSMTKER